VAGADEGGEVGPRRGRVLFEGGEHGDVAVEDGGAVVALPEGAARPVVGKRVPHDVVERMPGRCHPAMMAVMSAAVDAAFAIADEFLATFNALDAPGHAATLTYPHVRLASGTVRVWETIEEATEQMTRAMASIRERLGWDHSEWDHKRLIHEGAGKVHLDVCFTRYRPDGSVIGVYPAVYVVVDVPGTGWRIQARSSYAP
jgi:hypothetical protein